MTIKDRAAGWAQSKPVRAIVVVSLVGLVVGLLVGVGAGFKIEQHRVHKDITNLKNKLAGGTTPTTPHAGSKGSSGSGRVPVERAGTVTATGSGTITIATKQHGSLSLHLTTATHIDQAVNGSTSDIAVGRRVLVAKGAHDVIVLPTGSQIGRTVTKVANGVASMTKIKGVAQLQLSKVTTVDSTSNVPASDIKTGSVVLAWYQPGGKKSSDAVAIVLLPAGSAFA